MGQREAMNGRAADNGKLHMLFSELFNKLTAH
jgi:hypothetical protein